MTYIVDRTATGVIFPIRIQSDSGSPIESLTFETVGLSADFKVAGEAAWTSITLVAGTLAVWASGGFVEDSGGDGWYELGLPAAAIVAGKVTEVRVKTSGNEYRYGSVSATGFHPSDIATALAAYNVSVVSPVDSNGVLTIVQNADYVDGSVAGPLRFELSTPGIAAGDSIRFGASVPGDTTIQATGTVVDDDGTLYGEIELNKTDHTARVATERGCYELEHVDGSGNVSPLLIDKRMVIKPSHAEA